MPVPPAWAERENAAPQWASLGFGVRFLLKPLRGEVQAEINAKVADLMAGLRLGRRDLRELGFDDADLGLLGDLNVVAGLSTYAFAVFAAERLLVDWEGLDDPATGEKVPIGPEAIRAAFRIGSPEGSPPLLQPFMAWIAAPRQPLAAELRRLRDLGQWEHGAGIEHCKGCDVMSAECAKGGDDAGALCPRIENAPRTAAGIDALDIARRPGVWRRAGMDGTLTGLDYAACLAGYAGLDEGSVVRCLAAIEQGALMAAAERAKRDGG